MVHFELRHLCLPCQQLSLFVFQFYEGVGALVLHFARVRRVLDEFDKGIEGG